MSSLAFVILISTTLSAKPQTFTLLEDEIMLDDSISAQELTFPIQNNAQCNLKIFKETEENIDSGNVKLEIVDFFDEPNFDGFYNGNINCNQFHDSILIKLQCDPGPDCMGNHFVYSISLYCSGGSPNTFLDMYEKETTTVQQKCDDNGIVHVKHLPNTKCIIHVHDNGDCPITTKWFIVPKGQAPTTGKNSGDFREKDSVQGSRSYFWECIGEGELCEAIIDIYCVVIPGEDIKNDLENDKFEQFEGGCKEEVYTKIFEEEVNTFCPVNNDQKGIIRKLVNLPPVPCDIHVNDKGDCPITTKWFFSFGNDQIPSVFPFSGKQKGDMRISDKPPGKNEIVIYGQRTFMWECNNFHAHGNCQADIDIYCAL